MYRSLWTTAIVGCTRSGQEEEYVTYKLDKLVRKADSVVGTELDSLTSVTERR